TSLDGRIADEEESVVDDRAANVPEKRQAFVEQLAGAPGILVQLGETSDGDQDDSNTLLVAKAARDIHALLQEIASPRVIAGQEREPAQTHKCVSHAPAIADPLKDRQPLVGERSGLSIITLRPGLIAQVDDGPTLRARLPGRTGACHPLFVRSLDLLGRAAEPAKHVIFEILQAPDDAGMSSRAPREIPAFVENGLRRPSVSLLCREDTCSNERLGTCQPDRWERIRWHGRFRFPIPSEHLIEPSTTLGVVSALAPEPPELARQPDGGIG